jgi:hypothetical protein
MTTPLGRKAGESTPSSTDKAAATAADGRGFGAEMLQAREQSDAPSRMRARIASRPQDSPEVTIEKGAFGAYFLSVAGLNARAKVKRVQ